MSLIVGAVVWGQLPSRHIEGQYGTNPRYCTVPRAAEDTLTLDTAAPIQTEILKSDDIAWQGTRSALLCVRTEIIHGLMVFHVKCPL